MAEHGRRRLLLWVNAGMAAYALLMAPLFALGTAGTVTAVALGFLFMGLAYGPIGTVLAELFPAQVRYTGSSLAYNLAGHLRRLAGAVHRYRAGHRLRAGVRGLLHVCGGGGHAAGAGGRPAQVT
jgi:hypothetical protein